MASFAPGSDRGGAKRNISASAGGGWTLGGVNARATLTTALAGANNDLKYTSVGRGTAQNSVRVRYVVAGTNTALSVSVSGNDITVNSATDGGGAATSTATAVKNAVTASTPASALVTVDNAPGNDGTGVITALAFTNLAGGTEYVLGGSGLTRVKAPL